ncbi:MAG TPA: 4-(cytidine 5'-diphospho)-2-C-methyl-D-erythritol kinase [Terriglobales bacterium]|nr:4-(cytidine 5'-diphospho)-2-C-methyl-D-erythritol kinase [Terriglobales bacterium]
MTVKVRSFAKINLGLCIGAARRDGFHELRTVYQTVGLHDVLSLEVSRGSGIEILCDDPRVPTDESNTCYRVAERVMVALSAKGRVSLGIEKRLPLQGGVGGASSNAVATMLALELALKKRLGSKDRFRIASEVGSDLPLFLVGGSVLGVGHGEEVYPLPDLPATACVIATPEIGVSTPQAFRDWDESIEAQRPSASQTRTPGPTQGAKLTAPSTSDRMNEFSRTVAAWLSGYSGKAGLPTSGVPARGRGRAETPLLDLVHTGIENDFEKVVFPKYPELKEVKTVLRQAGAFYASLSGSGSAVYGLFGTAEQAQKGVSALCRRGIPAAATSTLTRQQYWRKFLVSSF